jgi:hypothetical protein
VDQPLPVGMSEPCLEAFGLSVADPDQCRGHPLRRGDIFPWQ